MKRIIFLIIFIILPLYVFPQHTLILKSGEKFQGKLSEYKKGQLKFLFKNNVMTFNDKDLVSIIFDSSFAEKPKDDMVIKENAVIKGVVTYYFNRNYGYKPDVGAEVYIINYKDLGNADTLSIKNFTLAKIVRNTMSMSEDDYKIQCYKQLTELNAETKDKFDSLDWKCYMAVSLIQRNKKKVKMTVDGSGAFSKLLLPGDYFILIISNHRKGVNATDLMGKLDYKQISLSKNGEGVVNVEFNERY
jgi:hypothetical protein